MQVEIGSELARQLFPSTFESTPFESLLPPHQFLVTALSDPSVTPESLSNVIGVDVLNAAGAKDLQVGAQRMLYTMVLRYEGVLSGLANGIPTDMREPLELVSKFAWKFGSAIGDDTLDEFLIESAWAGGMKALGALGPVGKAAAAIAGFAREVIRTFQDMKKMQAADALQRERMVFARMPPLQQPNEETDTFIVNTVVMPAMETGAWTRLFLPRFNPRGSWKGIERNGGFAFAPGKSIKGSTDEFGREVDVFDTAGGGVGMVPGFDQVSSVIQVSADPFSPAMRAFKEGTPGNINWPIGPDQVVDVGRYYINTGRLCAIAWAWATAADASPHLYKLHVGEPGKGEGHLHDAWENYCAGGIRYLTEMAEDWQQGGKKMLLSGNLEYVYGSGLALAVGAWTCSVDGGKLLEEKRQRQLAEARAKIAREAVRLLRQASGRFAEARRTDDAERAAKLREEGDLRLSDIERLDPEAWPWAKWMYAVRDTELLVPENGGAPVFEGLRIARPRAGHEGQFDYLEFGQVITDDGGQKIGIRAAGSPGWELVTYTDGTVSGAAIRPDHMLREDGPAWPDDDGQR